MNIGIFSEKRPLIMGILNVTPDSFSDGGDYFTTDAAIDRGLKLISQGADILDIGGESTRPFSEPVACDEEIRRVVPVINGIRAKNRECIISVDTYKAPVAKASLEAGANIINDISALQFDKGMAEVVVQYDAMIVLMHIKGTPRDMQINPHYKDLWDELLRYFDDRIEFAIKSGIKTEKIILDPGIGFGKTAEHNIEIIRGLGRLKKFGFPILIGNSRKSFLGKFTGIEVPKERDHVSLVADIFSLLNGADIIRVHNVKMYSDALKIFLRCRGKLF